MDQYIFVELSSDFVMGLESLRQQFPQKANRIDIVREEANSFLQSWCEKQNWRTTRAVVFLDPYGMQVEWKTIDAIAHTKAIDLWILCPLGQAVNRLLTKNQPPSDSWAARLTKFFGTEEWKKAFYRTPKQTTLFGPEDSLQKNADFDSIGKFFINRLETVFVKVAQNPLPLRNSRNVPIFLLCFASANPKGAPTAVKIAQYILGK
ncbi:MAG: three-Cys-motif partner protein TcmP [bacterium]